MHRKFWASLALCAVLTIGVAGPAAAQKQPTWGAPTAGGGVSAAGGDVIVFRVCNRSSDPANVAVSYQPTASGRFYNEGWYTVAAGQCRDLIQTDNAYIYGYAEVLNDGARFWAGDHGLCVIYPGPYAFWSDDSEYCPRGTEVRDFVVMHALDWGVFTWNLDPPQ